MNKSKSGNIPIRTCVSCGRKRPKGHLLRLVLDAEEGALCYGAHPGRGAYVCRDMQCWKSLSARGRLRRAFRRECTVSLPADPPWAG